MNALAYAGLIKGAFIYLPMCSDTFFPGRPNFVGPSQFVLYYGDYIRYCLLIIPHQVVLGLKKSIVFMLDSVRKIRSHNAIFQDNQRAIGMSINGCMIRDQISRSDLGI